MCLHICMVIHILLYMYVCIHTYAHIYIYAKLLHIGMSICVGMYSSICICMCTCRYAHAEQTYKYLYSSHANTRTRRMRLHEGMRINIHRSMQTYICEMPASPLYLGSPSVEFVGEPALSRPLQEHDERRQVWGHAILGFFAVDGRPGPQS